MNRDTNMSSLGDSLRTVLAKDETYHIPASDGDYVDENCYLCCGKCRTPKEFRHYMEPPLSFWMIEPCMCHCQQKEYESERAAEHRQQDQLVVEKLFRYSLVDERFRESTFDRFQETKENARALTICRNYVRYFDKMYESSTGLLMYGSPGTGKTFAAACIANALIQRGIPVMAASIVKLTNAGVFDDLQEVLARMKRAQLLILDDFGAERNTDFKAEKLFDVIDSRYASKRPMIITTNIPLDHFKSDPDVRRRRIYDRILEVCHPVKMDWESFRIKAVRASYDNTKRILEEG